MSKSINNDAKKLQQKTAPNIYESDSKRENSTRKTKIDQSSKSSSHSSTFGQDTITKYVTLNINQLSSS